MTNIIAHIKYAFYFHRLLFRISLMLAYMTFNNINVMQALTPELILKINHDIKSSGFVTIKLIQWTLSRYKNFKSTTYKENQVYQFLSNFNDVYENCNIHSIDHTKKVFQEDFNAEFADEIILDVSFNISSASIAQVYKGTLRATGETVAIKVRHPNLHEQWTSPYCYYIIYQYLTERQKLITWFHRFKLPFDMSNFFDNFVKQTDMTNEAKNLEFFYNNYRDNPAIIIPKPILWSRNILIMEYVDGEIFESLSCTRYTQYKIISLLNLFLRNNLIILSKNHSDLHSSNWKVILNSDTNKNTNTNKTPNIQLVIYDFGFCIDIQAEYRETLINLSKAVETNNHEQFIELLYNYLATPEIYDKSKYLRDCKESILNNNTTITLPTFIEFCASKGYTFRSDILDLLLSQFLANNYFKNFTSSSNVEDDFANYDKFRENKLDKLEKTNNQLMNLSAICDTYKSFIELNIFFKEYIVETRRTIQTIKREIINRRKTSIDNNINNINNIQIPANDCIDI